MTQRTSDTPDRVAPFAMTEGPLEKVCRWICLAALTTMLVLIAVDIFTRSLFNYSLEIADELAGYMLVVITFLSFPVCQVTGSFHEVELLQARLSPRRQAISRAVFDLASLFVAVLLLWKYWALVLQSWRFQEHAPTYLETPLWIPRTAMVIGMAALAVSLIRTFTARLVYLRQTALGSDADGN